MQGTVITRRADWPAALPVAIADWLGRPTVLGEADCGLMVWDVAARGLGVQLSARPPYACARGAMRLGRRGGPPVWLARRLELAEDPALLSDGDLLALPPDPEGRGGVCGSIGVINGAAVWTMRDAAGLEAVPVVAWLAVPEVVGASLRDGAQIAMEAR